MKKVKRPTPDSKVELTEIRRRLAGALAATEGTLTLSPERARAVMDERAQALARVPAAVLEGADTLEVVSFGLGNERYAIEAAYVREVVRLTDYTPVPGAPDFLVGVLNLRGEILAVIDLRKFLTVEAQGLTDLSRVIVLGGERAEFGVLADSAHEVVTLRANEVLEPPASAAGVGREYLRGVTGDSLVVLDGSVLLEDSRLLIDVSDEGEG